MAQIKISQFPIVPSLAGSDIFPAVKAGVDYKVTITQTQNFFGIYSGAGAPLISPPNGSIYLRNDGHNTTTLYVRANGGWAALS